MPRGHENVEHGHHVQHLGHLRQVERLGQCVRHAARGQRRGHLAQGDAAPREHHHFAGPEAPGAPRIDQRGHRAGRLRRLGRPRLLLGLAPRLGQRVPPALGDTATRPLRPRQPGQPPHGAARPDLGGVVPERPERERAVVRVGRRRQRPEHRVDRIDDLLRAAPGVVAGQREPVQRTHDEVPRRREHARLGAAEAVDALLRIADEEQRQRPLPAGTPSGARVGLQPASQHLPLRRAGVLEFVDQQVAQPQIEPLLQPRGVRAVAEQLLRDPLEVVHVDQPAFALERGVLVQQHPRQQDERAVIDVGPLLRAHLLHLLQPPDDLVAQHAVAQLLARHSFIGEQGRPRQPECRSGVAGRCAAGRLGGGPG